MKQYLFCLFFLSLALFAQAQESRVDTPAVLLLDRMSIIIGELNSCSFDLESSFDVPDNSFFMPIKGLGLVKHTANHEVYMQGPDKMLINTRGDRGHHGYWYNGEQIAYYNYDENNYAIVEAPDNIMETIHAINENYGIDFPAADFFYPTFTDDLLDNCDQIVLLGITNVDGKPCFHVASACKDMNIQIWITNDALMLPKKMVIVYLNHEMKPQYQATFSNWKLNPDLPPSMFNFGRGASWRNIAGGRPNFSLPELSHIAENNLQIFKDLQDISNIDFRTINYVTFAHDEAMVKALNASIEWSDAYMIEPKDFQKEVSPYMNPNLDTYQSALVTGGFAFLALILGGLLQRRLVDPLVAEVFALNDQLSEREQKLSRLSTQLSRYLSPQLYRSMFAGDTEAKIFTQRKKLTVFFSDVVGFTARADSMEPEDLAEQLNTYFDAMARLVQKHGGTLDKFVGDALLVFFGDPESRGVKEDALACVRMAWEMRDVIQQLVSANANVSSR